MSIGLMVLVVVFVPAIVASLTTSIILEVWYRRDRANIIILDDEMHEFKDKSIKEAIEWGMAEKPSTLMREENTEDGRER